MRGFLDEVAEKLYAKYGTEVGSLKLIFPSRRSRIFFTEALSRVATQPIWQPQWLSIDDLMSQATPLVRGENIRLISELYKVYSAYHTESFDKFFFWGEVLLSDFDMIDKYMVDADMLFTNVSDIKLLESDISYLTPEQLNIIAAFWDSLKSGADLSREKQRFLKVWESLPKIYHQFRARCMELGIGYTGMIQRSAVERLKSHEACLNTQERYVAVGFNALSECEKRLFDFLSKSSNLELFWDYDDYYTKQEEQEAGLFIRDNLVRYGSQHDISHDNFRQEKSIEVVAAASNVLQCKYASKIISSLAQSGAVDKNTAIVLTDENLLTPLLYALPPQAGKVNVTMGYPIKQSLAYSFVERLLSLISQSKRRLSGDVSFYYNDVITLLAHPYINSIDKELFAQIESDITTERLISVDREFLITERPEYLASIFVGCNDWQSLSVYLQQTITFVAQQPYVGDDASRRVEFLSTIIEHINALHNSLDSCGIELSLSIYLSLLRRQLQSLRVPFEGEPLEGLQVMGILETRNLDFENVVILSMNDDNFPGNRLTAPSYVPYSIRSAYGIPTPEHHEGVFAYYFYRLIQRAKKVWMLYCSHADDKSTGEASRYIYQMDYESPFKLKRTNVGVDVNLYDHNELSVAKTGEVERILSRYTDPDNPVPISPSAINRYVACPLRFYFYHIARLRGNDELSEDVDNSMFGNIFHQSIQQLYQPLIGCDDISSALEKIKGDRALVEREVDSAIRSVCKIRDGVASTDFAGDLVLIKDIVVKYILDGVVAYDAANPDFRVLGVEAPKSYSVSLPNGKSITIEGTLDRVDELRSGALRVIDYKSGGKHLEFKSVESLFEGGGAERQGHIIQTLTYSMMLHHTEGKRVVPSLYYVRFMHSPNYSPLLVDKSTNGGEITSYELKRNEFEEYLTQTLSQLLDCSVPFSQAEDKEGTCTYCDFKSICRVG